MAVTTKAEAEALTVPELKKELEARGLATEGIKAVLLETLLNHMENAANGEPFVPKDGEPVETKADMPVAEKTPEAYAPDGTDPPTTRSQDADAAVTRSADDTTGDAEASDSKKTTEGAPEVVGDAAAEKGDFAPAGTDPPTTRSEDTDTAVTRSAEEVSGGTEEPEAKKTKVADDPAPAAEPATA